MQIQWFPGHMQKAKKVIEQRLKCIDLVIEVLDARLPYSSSNPLLAELSRNKTKLKLLNKADLADPEITQIWLDYLHTQANTHALAITAHEVRKNNTVIEHCRNLCLNRSGMDKPLRILICGVPNVGKSSLINSLLGRYITKTGNEVGVTREEQRLILADDIWLYDTPGMLWQKILIPESGYRLAIAGSVGRNAYDDELLVLHLLDYLKQHYWKALVLRYDLAEVDRSIDSNELLTLLAKKRGAILSRGYINYQKIAEVVLQDFRLARMGRLSLEKPSEWLTWQQSAMIQEEARIKAKEERLKLKKKRQ